ncbi:MAG: DedA family protein [Aestuariivirgaceae bacterium]|nr:DedA family protein [Aestuariivirgaceae bacterium]
MMELFSLFTSALLSATVLPGSSEAVLAGFMAMDTVPVLALVAAATLGNVLGSLFNWFLGLNARKWENHPRFPVKPADMARFEAIYARYGRWSLLASWVPFFGDPITLAAGIARTPLVWFLPLVTCAKAARYGVVVAVASQVL